AALPAHGLSDEVARKVRYTITPEYASLFSFRSGRPYVAHRARNDPGLLPEIVEAASAESRVLMPMLSEGAVLGLLVAVNKPGGFTGDDVQLLSIFAGPAASFIRSRQIFDHQRMHALRLERVAGLAGEMSATLKRQPLLALVAAPLERDLGFEAVAFWGGRDEKTLELEARAPDDGSPAAGQRDLLGW